MTTHVRPSAVKNPVQQARIDLAAAYRLIHRLGLDDSIYTHISARVPGTHDRFLINPYGMRFEEVTASNLVMVDIDGNIVDDPLNLGINPAGFTIHSALHMNRDDAHCIIHLHTTDGVAVSAQAEPFDPQSIVVECRARRVMRRAPSWSLITSRGLPFQSRMPI